MNRKKEKPPFFRNLSAKSCKTCEKWVKVDHSCGNMYMDGGEVFGCAVYLYTEEPFKNPENYVCDLWRLTRH